MMFQATIRHAVRTFIAKVKGSIKDRTTKIAYEHLKLPLKEQTFRLAQDQCFANAAEALSIFGHATLRGVLSESEVSGISDALEVMGAGHSSLKTIITIAPLEKSRSIQDVIFKSDLLEVLKKVLPPFWYCSSDAFVGYPVFSKHRDTFLNPCFYKIFVPLVPCAFSVLPGSHVYGDTYARTVGKYVTDWDSGSILNVPVSEVHFRDGNRKVVSEVHGLDSEALFVRRHLNPGDIFIFSQNAVHGLNSDSDRNFFLAITVVPSPAASHNYGFSRTEHLDRIVDNVIATSVCDYNLSGSRSLDPDENIFTGYKFSEDDLSSLVQGHAWNDCFGLRFIEKDKWIGAFKALKYKGFQHIQDRL